MEKYIMTEQEYAALDKALSRSLHYSYCFILQKDGCDYFALDEKPDDYKSKRVYVKGSGFVYLVPVLEYMKEEDDSLCDFVECYEFTEEDIEAYDELCKKAGCYYHTCKER